MFCKSCGAELVETDRFCGHCGKPVQPEIPDVDESAEEETVFIGNIDPKYLAGSRTTAAGEMQAEQTGKVSGNIPDIQYHSGRQSEYAPDAVVNLADSVRTKTAPSQPEHTRGKLGKAVLLVILVLFIVLAGGAGGYHIYKTSQPSAAVEVFNKAYQESDWDKVYGCFDFSQSELTKQEFVEAMKSAEFLTEYAGMLTGDKTVQFIPVSTGLEYTDEVTGRTARDVAARVDIPGMQVKKEIEIKMIKSDEKYLFFFPKWKIAGDSINSIMGGE